MRTSCVTFWSCGIDVTCGTCGSGGSPQIWTCGSPLSDSSRDCCPHCVSPCPPCCLRYRRGRDRSTPDFLLQDAPILSTLILQLAWKYIKKLRISQSISTWMVTNIVDSWCVVKKTHISKHIFKAH